MAKLTGNQKQLLKALLKVGENNTVPSAVANKGSYYQIIRSGLIGRGQVVDRRFADVLRASGSGFAKGELSGTLSTVLNPLVTHGVLLKAGRGVYHLRIDTAKQVCFV